MKFRYLTAALALAGSLTACDQLPFNSGDKTPEVTAKPADDSEVLATVNGVPITANTLALYQQARQSRMPGNEDGQDRAAILEEIISLELASQHGERKGVDKNPDVLAQMAQQRRALVASAAFQRQMKKHPITDHELKALYDEKIQAGNEYKARHILVESKANAEVLIAELDKGADFSELAIKNSTGPSGKSGGDLGWFSPKSMVKPFSEAVAGMDKGSYTHEPVQTQFGWHIILLEDSRESTPPPFEQVKPQLEMIVRSQRVQDYINKLRSTAIINISDSVAASVPATAPAADEHADHAHSTETATADDAASEDKPAAEESTNDNAAAK